MFEFWKENILIGHSKLENGDAPMGVAFGKFFTTEKFEAFRLHAEYLDDFSRRWEGLIVKTSNEQEIECVGAVIIEYGQPTNILSIEATCIGISCPLYEKLFPQHVKMYKEQFEE